MTSDAVKSVIIAGGGTAGWMAAAMLNRAFNGRLLIRLIESEEIGTVGVGEATIPTLIAMTRFLGLDEDEMMKASQATFKLGIEFADWYRVGQSYAHQFGPFGKTFGLLPLYQYWLKRHLDGDKRCGALWDYSFNDRAARMGRFARGERIPDTPLDGLTYAFQFDAARFAAFLRGRCEGQGVERIEGRITAVNLRPEDGFIGSLTL
ncbi:MAG: tryptophan 7-halogenase, partial [Asticcacaulis sp.]